jgi:hypothetical protein
MALEHVAVQAGESNQPQSSAIILEIRDRLDKLDRVDEIVKAVTAMRKAVGQQPVGSPDPAQDDLSSFWACSRSP